MKPSRKLAFLRYWNSLWIYLGHRSILRAARTEKRIYLSPTRPRGCGGHVDEYYHFIFDLALPLFHLIRQTPPDVKFVLDHFGINTPRIRTIFPERVVILGEETTREYRDPMKLVGMNPKGIIRHRGMYEGFRSHVLQSLGIDEDHPRDEVLLIERMMPDADFAEEATIGWSGSLRRSIVNHAELSAKLGRMVRDPYEFHNLRLEEVPFEEQLTHFSRAEVVIAQHGAGLANCIWMEPGSTVLELNHMANVTHFNMVSEAKSHRYSMYLTDGPHASVDVGDFAAWVSTKPGLEKIFRTI